MQKRFLRPVSYIAVSYKAVLLMHFSTHCYLLLCFVIKDIAPTVTRQCLSCIREPFDYESYYMI